ncbi:M protein, putative [Eimeria maxima]|uniref:M protein, putative n=1 Tax=Eimeria maxima TaxID=5804 RepID=U6MA04_EIMMA|nr:M protein, putative [Eimeria maxima]CDJ58490.1 M protein, putative [Eimeria maxima]
MQLYSYWIIKVDVDKKLRSATTAPLFPFREYDAKRSAHGEEPSGVLDQTIRSLRTQISQNSQNITELQQAWIKKQTELISLQAKVGEKQEEIAAKKDEMLIRKQHSHRINAEVEATKKEIKSLNSELKDMDHLVDRMGRQLAAFKQQQVQFESQAKAIQEEAQMQIAQKEQEKQNLLNNVQEAEKERDGSLEELLDLERQVTLWERKIKLEKEIQDAIDPNIGQAELAAMRKEIHRMELREIQLKKTQQHLLKELKQVLSKRDLIHMRHAPKTGTAQETHKKVVLQRQITALDSKLRETEVRLAFEKACLVHLQRLTKDLESITDEDLKIPLKPSAQLALHKVQNEAANVAAAIGEVEQEAPALQEVLELFKKWAVHLVSANDTYKLQPEALRFSD